MTNVTDIANNRKGFKSFKHFSNMNSSQLPVSSYSEGFQQSASQLSTVPQLEDVLKSANLPPRSKVWEFCVFVFK